MRARGFNVAAGAALVDGGDAARDICDAVGGDEPDVAPLGCGAGRINQAAIVACKSKDVAAVGFQFDLRAVDEATVGHVATRGFDCTFGLMMCQ